MSSFNVAASNAFCGEEFVKNEAERIDVAADCCRLTIELFRAMYAGVRQSLLFAKLFG